MCGASQLLLSTAKLTQDGSMWAGIQSTAAKAAMHHTRSDAGCVEVTADVAGACAFAGDASRRSQMTGANLAAAGSLTWSSAGLCCSCALRSLVSAGNWRSLLLRAATRPKLLAVAAARLRAPCPRAVPMLSHESGDLALCGFAKHRFASMACVSELFAGAGLSELSWPEPDVGAGLRDTLEKLPRNRGIEYATQVLWD